MEIVQFISIEDEHPDLILSFAIEDSQTGIKSFILMRAPEYEALLPVEERGVSVSFEGDTDFDVNLLKKISVSGGVVDVLSTHKNYKFSISSIELDDIKEMEKTLKRLNFDSTFEMTFS